MKLAKFKSALVFALLLGVFAIGAKAQAEPMVGAYDDLAVGSKEAKAAAAAAVKKYSSSHTRDRVTLVKIIKGDAQVVAGMNYRICMIVKNRRGVRRTVTAVVYRPPNGKLRSTAWDTGSCKDI